MIPPQNVARFARGTSQNAQKFSGLKALFRLSLPRSSEFN
jgi:hypothetical protein